MQKREEKERTVDEQEDAEAKALLVLAEWINCQGDSGETAQLMDDAERELPGKVE
jgi:hypothetical protein